MPKIKKTRDELEHELGEQALALRASAKSYDDGNRWEAKRIASTLHILLHDSQGGRSRSLLGILGHRSSLRFLSSISEPTTKPGHIGWNSAHFLVVAQTKYPHALYVPKLEPNSETYRPLRFEDWYEEVIFRGLTGATVSRKNLMHYFRSQDGGAHVDTHLESEAYAYWKSKGDPSLRYKTDLHGVGVAIFGPMIELATGRVVYEAPDDGEPLKYAPHASMRQMAWEVDQALIQLGY